MLFKKSEKWEKVADRNIIVVNVASQATALPNAFPKTVGWNSLPIVRTELPSQFDLKYSHMSSPVLSLSKTATFLSFAWR